MKDLGLRCCTMQLVAFGTFLVLLPGVIKTVAGVCEFNGEGYNPGQTVAALPETCTSIVCKEKKEEGGDVSFISTQSMDSCECQTSSNQRADNGALELIYPIYRINELTDENTRSDRRGSPMQRAKGGRSRTKKCSFNGESFKNKQTVANFEDRCFELKCVKQSGSSSIKPAVNASCSCASTGGSSTSTQAPPAERGESSYKCEDYQGFNQQHAMCLPPNPNCEVDRRGVTEEEIETIVSVHNELRAKVANGNEPNGDPGPQPSATNMRELVWNDELAAVAQAWADQCPYRHDCYPCRKLTQRNYYVGQNIFWAFGFNDIEEWALSIQYFYLEVSDLPNTRVSGFGPLENGAAIGHYTQLVWANTYEIGCGAIYKPCTHQGTSYPYCKTYVCNYGPAGNFINMKIYDVGEPASKCTHGKSEKTPGLCN